MKRLLCSLVCLLIMSAAAAAQTACFKTTGVFTTSPLGAAVLDSNRDGKLDVALLAQSRIGNANLVESYLGRGNGTFTALAAYPGPGTPYVVAPGDFNGDGNPDLAIGFQAKKGQAGIVSILLGNGDGTFGNPYNVQTAQRIDEFAIGDFNGDGKLDVVATTGPDYAHFGNVELLLGNGDGTLQAPTVVSSFPYFTPAVSAADLNHDGKLDLVTVGGDATGANQMISVFLGNGDGTFQAGATYTDGTNQKPSLIALVDLDGDGNLDVVDPATPGLDVFYGTGTGTFNGPVSISMFLAPLAVRAIDVFGDGRTDLVAQIYTGSVGIAVNNGNKKFTVQYVTSPEDGGIMQVGDFNNDGKTDLLFSVNDGNESGIYIFLNCS